MNKMTDHFSKIRDWERDYSQYGLLPDEQSEEAELFKQRRLGKNQHRSEAMAICYETTQLEKLKAFLSRGNLKSAQEIMQTLQSQRFQNHDLFIEQLLEAARIEAYKGQWSKVIQMTSIALKNKPNPLTALTLHQVRALSHFENNEIADCLYDLERIESLASLYPNASGVFYGKILAVKCECLIHGANQAKDLYQKLWQSILNNNEIHILNLDKVLTLTRLGLELDELLGKDYSSWAVSNYLLAKALGDEVYLNDALIDLSFSNSPELSDFSSNCLKAKNLEQRQLLRKEKRAHAKDKVKFSGKKLPFSTLQSTHLIFQEQELVVDLEKKEIFLSGKKKQLFEALISLAENSMDKESFFEFHWGCQRFEIEKHDNLIRNVLSRVRKNFGVEIEVNDHLIMLRNSFIQRGINL